MRVEETAVRKLLKFRQAICNLYIAKARLDMAPIPILSLVVWKSALLNLSLFVFALLYSSLYTSILMGDTDSIGAIFVFGDYFTNLIIVLVRITCD